MISAACSVPRCLPVEALVVPGGDPSHVHEPTEDVVVDVGLGPRVRYLVEGELPLVRLARRPWCTGRSGPSSRDRCRRCIPRPSGGGRPRGSASRPARRCGSGGAPSRSRAPRRRSRRGRSGAAGGPGPAAGSRGSRPRRSGRGRGRSGCCGCGWRCPWPHPRPVLWQLRRNPVAVRWNVTDVTRTPAWLPFAREAVVRFAAMEFRILGALEVAEDGHKLALGGPEAARRARAPDPAGEPRRRGRPADRRAVGRGAARERPQHPADLRLPPAQAAR